MYYCERADFARDEKDRRCATVNIMLEGSGGYGGSFLVSENASGSCLNISFECLNEIEKFKEGLEIAYKELYKRSGMIDGK